MYALLGGTGIGGQILAKVMYYLFYVVILIVLGVVGWYVYYHASWKMTMYYWPVHGSGTGTTSYSVGKLKKNLVKWNPRKTAWKLKTPFLNKKEIEPFPPEHIFQGQTMYAFKVGDEYVPATINYDHKSLNNVPYHVRNWQSMIHKKLAIELSERSFWDDNKYFFMVVVTAGICLAAVCVTVYYTYDFVKPAQASMDMLSRSISGITNIGGVAPG